MIRNIRSSVACGWRDGSPVDVWDDGTLALENPFGTSKYQTGNVDPNTADLRRSRGPLAVVWVLLNARWPQKGLGRAGKDFR